MLTPSRFSESLRDIWPNVIDPIPPNPFALATRFHFVLSDDVPFPEQDSPALARATEILAQLGAELCFIESGNTAKADRSP